MLETVLAHAIRSLTDIPTSSGLAGLAAANCFADTGAVAFASTGKIFMSWATFKAMKTIGLRACQYSGSMMVTIRDVYANLVRQLQDGIFGLLKCSLKFGDLSQGFFAAGFRLIFLESRQRGLGAGPKALDLLCFHSCSD